jgi:hypothetical protein
MRSILGPAVAALALVIFLIAANLAEAELQFGGYEAVAYTHHGFPWTALITDDDYAYPSREIHGFSEFETQPLWLFKRGEGSIGQPCFDIVIPIAHVIVLPLGIAKDAAFVLALFAPLAAWFFTRRRGVRMNRIHLRTAVVLAIAAGVLLGLNLAERAADFYGVTVSGPAARFDRGWPFPYRVEWLNHFSDERAPEFQKFGCAADAIVALLILFSVALASEATLARQTYRTCSITRTFSLEVSSQAVRGTNSIDRATDLTIVPQPKSSSSASA